MHDVLRPCLAVVLASPSAFAADHSAPSRRSKAFIMRPMCRRPMTGRASTAADVGYEQRNFTITMGPVSDYIPPAATTSIGGVERRNWQTTCFVFGVETDFQAAGGLRGDVNGNAGPIGITGSTKTPWFGTIRGRIGYTFDRWMVYATGGSVCTARRRSMAPSPPPALSNSPAPIGPTWSAAVRNLRCGVMDTQAQISLCGAAGFRHRCRPVQRRSRGTAVRACRLHTGLNYIASDRFHLPQDDGRCLQQPFAVGAARIPGPTNPNFYEVYEGICLFRAAWRACCSLDQRRRTCLHATDACVCAAGDRGRNRRR